MRSRQTYVLVGHCWADRAQLKSAVKRMVPGARIVRANTTSALDKHLGSGAVLLVNRVLGGRFETESGVVLIRRLAETDDPPLSILVSSYPDDQAEAMAAGARLGFGKSRLHDAATAAILREAAVASAKTGGGNES